MKIILSGYCGHMGQEVKKLADAGCRGTVLVAGVDQVSIGSEMIPCAKTFDAAAHMAVCETADCVVDFSHRACTRDLLAFCMAMKLPVVVATTGHTEEEKAAIAEAAHSIPVFYSGNMSYGIALLTELAKKTAAAFPDAEIEIVEAHHDRKLDAPSGTAHMLVDALCEVRPEAYPVMGRNGLAKRTAEEIGVHSLRMGNVVGMHEVIVATQSQTITLKHEAHSRALFAEGALAAAEFLCGKQPGLYDMSDLARK